MDVDVIVPGHGPIRGKKELVEMGQYLELFKREARKRFDAGLRPGQAAAQISLGKFDNWIGARGRLVMNTVRLYHEFDGTLAWIFRARVYPDVAKSVEMPAAAKLSASLSLLLWFAIIVTSRLIGFVGPEY